MNTGQKADILRKYLASQDRDIFKEVKALRKAIRGLTLSGAIKELFESEVFPVDITFKFFYFPDLE